MKNSLILALVMLFMNNSCVQPKHPKNIKFTVDARELESVYSIGIRGSISPLSWEKTVQLLDLDANGIYEGTIQLNTAQNGLEFKFVHSDSMFELENQDNRHLQFEYKPENLSYKASFNDQSFQNN